MSDEEIELLTRIIENPDSSDNKQAEAYFERGLEYVEQKKYTEAIADYTEAIELYTDDDDKALAYLWRGDSYYEQGKYVDAIDNYTKAIELYTDDDGKARAYEWRGHSYREQEKYAEAIADYTEAIELHTEEDVKAAAYQNRGNTYLKHKKYPEALADYTEAIDLFTNDNKKAKSYTNRGEVYFAQGKYPEAIADYEDALRLNPDSQLAQLNKSTAESKRETQKTEKAREEIQALSGEARSVGLAKEYEDEQKKLEKSVKTWTKCFIGGILSLLLIPILTLYIPWIRTIISKDPSMLTSVLTALSHGLPMLWFTSFCAKRRSEATMLLQEYTHKTICAKSYLGYKQHIETLQTKDPALLPKLVDATIEVLKRNPAYIFRKKHSSDMPIEELQKVTEFIQQCRNIVSLAPSSSNNKPQKKA